VLFIITQQVQPSFIMQAIASQQDWIISMHLESPLVQVIMTPSFVMSHLHIPIMRLQQQTIMPFIMTQQLHMPPASIVHRFCIMPQAALSAAVQVIFMPPVHFSILIVHRGTIIQLAAGIVGALPMAGVAMPGIPIPGIPIVERSIIMLDIPFSFRMARYSPRVHRHGHPHHPTAGAAKIIRLKGTDRNDFAGLFSRF
jgi:hypothetical protein